MSGRSASHRGEQSDDAGRPWLPFANCGTCHNRDEEISALVPSLHRTDLADGDAVARALAGLATRWQMPGQANGILTR